MTAPRKTGALRRGFVYLARLDKLRPVLVVSTNVRNDLASDVIVVPCTTRLSPAPTHVRLRRGEGGVSEPSVLKCEQITTLHKDDVRAQPLGGPLSALRVLEVERAILRAIGVPIPLE
ncbi:MAG: type II toxin-antitoxin system PemK/MazF family toxin [Labilithrix sp.]|nr:type II toxin-antitoxin system PemK/MazF family toxin [Labilithrix sp.]MBX3220525.1 type II toxin-antitoxin system PemK/MazF family toxin [Labilithrix sp.]